MQVHKNANETLKISDAYCYVKGNHIENQIAIHLEHLFEHSKKKAGFSWKFLEFMKIDDSDNHVFSFVVKNERYFNENRVSYGRNPFQEETNEKKYLKELINKNKDVNTERVRSNFKKSYQLDANELLFNERKEERKANFYIITYNIELTSEKSSSIKIWLPIPETNTAELIEDLTSIMNKVSDIDGYKFSQQEISILEASQEEKDEKTENVFSIVSGKKEQDKS
ncbi:spr1630 family ClpXP-sensitive toxin [Staphylococcus pettenkoferi]